MKKLIAFLGLKGSWRWACRQMKQGKIVRRKTDTGSAHYKLDSEGQLRIVWAFTRNPKTEKQWDSANLFLSDFSCVAWETI